MPTARIGDLDMYYELKGQGHPLVMIMGLSGNLEWWEPETVAILARDFRVLLFDNRESGRTRGPASPAPYSIQDMAADTVGLMDWVGFARAHVVGISMGGMIAQELALNYADRVDRLVLGCTTPGTQSGEAPPDEVLKVMTASQEGMSRLEVGAQLAKVTLAPGWMLTHFWKLPGLMRRTGRHPIRPDAYARQMGAIGGFEAGRRLANLKMPALVIHGNRDVLLPPGNARRLVDLVPGARLVVYAGAAHGFTTEKPKLFARTVRDFLLEGAVGAPAAEAAQAV